MQQEFPKFPPARPRRINLVAQFCCAKCGSFLSLSYEAPKVPAPNYGFSPDDGITGADKVLTKHYINPCFKCFDEAEGPAIALAGAIKKLLERPE